MTLGGQRCWEPDNKRCGAGTEWLGGVGSQRPEATDEQRESREVRRGGSQRAEAHAWPGSCPRVCDERRPRAWQRDVMSVGYAISAGEYPTQRMPRMTTNAFYFFVLSFYLPGGERLDSKDGPESLTFPFH